MDTLSIERRTASALLAALLLAAMPAFAQSEPRPRPPGTQPLEEVPPPPPMITTQPEPQPEITTRTEGEETIQEYRVNGKLYMQRVTPKHGKPYILMDLKGDGTFTKQDNPVDENIRVPQWVLLTF